MDIAYTDYFLYHSKTESNLQTLIGERRLEKETDFIPRIQQNS